jgi:hypothetical protein
VSVQGPPDAPGSSGPPGGPGGPASPTRPGATSQPLRAALVVVVAVAIAVGVLVRMSPAHSSASPPGTTHTAAVTTTTVPTGTATTLPAVVTTTSTTAVTAPPSSVTVLVLNGWTTEHAALYFQKKLAGDGYDTLAPNNALDETNATTTVFVVAPADGATGTAIAELLGVSDPQTAVMAPTATNDSAVPATFLHQADIIVVVGGDISKQVPVGYTGSA